MKTLPTLCSSVLLSTPQYFARLANHARPAQPPQSRSLAGWGAGVSPTGGRWPPRHRRIASIAKPAHACKGAGEKKSLRTGESADELRLAVRSISIVGLVFSTNRALSEGVC